MARPTLMHERLGGLVENLPLFENAEMIRHDERRPALLGRKAKIDVLSNLILGDPRELGCEQRTRVGLRSIGREPGLKHLYTEFVDRVGRARCGVESAVEDVSSAVLRSTIGLVFHLNLERSWIAVQSGLRDSVVQSCRLLLDMEEELR